MTFREWRLRNLDHQIAEYRRQQQKKIETARPDKKPPEKPAPVMRQARAF